MSEPTAESSPSMKSYDSGPFCVTESTTSIGGREWLTLKMSLSQELMIPLIDAFHYREAQLQAERTLLGMLNDRVTEAIDEIIESEGDK